MSEPDENLNLIEIIGGVLVLVGILLGVGAWWLGETFWNSVLGALLFIFGGGLIVLIGEGFRTGRLGIKGGHLNRERNKVAFWIFVLFYLLVALAFLSISAVFVLSLL